MKNPKYTSVSSLAFEVPHYMEDGSDIRGATVRRCLIKRLGSLDDREILEATVHELTDTQPTDVQYDVIEPPKGPPGGGSIVNRIIDTIQSLKVSERYPEYHVRAIYFDDKTGTVDSVMVDEPLTDDCEIMQDYKKIEMSMIGYAVYSGPEEPHFVCGDQYTYKVAKTLKVLLKWFYSTRGAEIQSR